jgi:predicted component of type VI protein secretion system
MARLILSLDDTVMAEFNMSKERYTIGRLPDNDVRIDNATVSGYHSLIINILNDSFLEDLNSTNGTYVNGKLIKKHALQHDDLVTVGKHQLRYVDSDQEDVEQDDEFARTMVIGAASDVKLEKPPEIRAAPPAAAPAAAAAAIAESDVALAEKPNPLMETSADMKTDIGNKPLPIAKVQVLNGKFAGREVILDKAVTTLGRPGVQVVAITRRADGYSVVQVENEKDRSAPMVNGNALGPQVRELKENDVVEIIGIKMGFFID